jgi:hypothetical protein
MAKHPLDDFPSTMTQGGNRATCGGDMTGCVKPLPYKEPVGPKGQMHKGPGLGGTNYSNSGTQGRR